MEIKNLYFKRAAKSTTIKFTAVTNDIILAGQLQVDNDQVNQLVSKSDDLTAAFFDLIKKKIEG